MFDRYGRHIIWWSMELRDGLYEHEEGKCLTVLRFVVEISLAVPSLDSFCKVEPDLLATGCLEIYVQNQA